MRHGLNAYLRVLIAVAALLPVIPRNDRVTFHRHRSESAFVPERTVRCAITLGHGLKESYKFGLNYELLHDFSAAAGFPIEICTLPDSAAFSDSLKSGSFDIVVAKAEYVDAAAGSFAYDGEHIWITRSDRAADIKVVNNWLSWKCATEDFRKLQRLFALGSPRKMLESGITSRVISPYDDIIKKYSRTLGWDWRMLAALIYTESKFTINNISARGAVGLMQVMPATGRKFGTEDLMNPEENIKAGTEFLKKIQARFPAGEFSDEERVNFVLASYNAGAGRISDCMKYAERRGLDSRVWDNICYVIPLMREGNISDEDELRYGKFHGGETIAYVRNVRATYEAYCTVCP